MNEVLNLVKKDYQVFVHGHKNDQGDVEFIRTPENVSEDLKSRNLGGSRYLNLHLIEAFKPKETGNFGGSSSSKQTTMFESSSPIHFGLLVDAIKNSQYDKQPDMEVTVGGDKRTVPVIKLRGVFEDSVHYTQAVDAYYLAFKKDGIYELQFTDRWVGDGFLSTPSDPTSISVVLFGADANEGNLLAALAKEARRMNVKAFNRDEIKALAMDSGQKISDPEEFKSWFATIAPGRIRKFYNEDAEETPTETPVIKTGEETGQDAPDANAQTKEDKPAAPQQEVV
jgi:hypothetical protein